MIYRPVAYHAVQIDAVVDKVCLHSRDRITYLMLSVVSFRFCIFIVCCHDVPVDSVHSLLFVDQLMGMRGNVRGILVAY